MEPYVRREGRTEGASPPPARYTGGETGIRTRESTFVDYSLSRRAPSASSAISPLIYFDKRGAPFIKIN